ncbi:MAG: manganese efflux pump [Peptococcaceae bacterium]|jgi:putative Mn2+ efflux pump MntP|nr:manganese efflux pump MntP family protein [Peptococcaceae bacterium]MDH7523730.1 manganese efflux pump [Peptococcaceae bacterium]
MNYYTVLLVSFALGIDAFSVAVGIGLSGVRKKQMLTVSSTVTLFHIFMPLLGLSLGSYLGRLAGPMAGSIGALILMTIGLSAVWNSLKELGLVAAVRNQSRPLDITSPVSLVLLGASVSLDALTVGFGLGALRVDLFLTVVTMGIVAGIMTMSGLLFGRRLNKAFGHRAGLAGGLILVVIGFKLLFP